MGDKNFRLDPGVRPERYAFTVAPDLATRSFRGRGTIELTLARAQPELVLHGSRIRIQSARVRAGAAAPVTASVREEAISQTLTLTPADPLPAGAITVELEWTGQFQDDLRGLYLAGPVGVTQFEAADARRVFPCFDEPAFKAVWDIEVEAAPRMAVVGNGRIVAEADLAGAAGDRRRVRLSSTPPMSSYLVALVVGDLVASPEVVVRGVPVRTWSTPDKAHLTGFAQQCAAAVLPLLEDYFGVPYAFGKLDQLGIPDFEAGAMENAGCITFREVILLLDLERAPLPLQKRAAEVITHELAHQWFGNLVTMAWWDDLWLNEAFATWMAFKIVDAWRPGWRMWDDFDGGKAAALHLDAMESTHPIHAEVRNADEATENFDVITYEKGGAMLRMIEGYLGADRFRAGMVDYMRRHAYGNAVADDLWGALERASGEPIQAVAHAWTHRGGFPLIDLAREEAGGTTRVRLSQRRFFAEPARLSGDEGESPWPVPVVLHYADDDGAREARVLLGGREAEVELPARGPVRFVCGNRGGAGFYRVRYAGDELGRLCAGVAALAPVERMNLLGDAWALFRAGGLPLSAGLEVLGALWGDRDYAVLGDVVGRLDGLSRRWLQAADRPRLEALVARAFAARLERAGWEPAADESDGQRLERAQLVRAMALVARAPQAVAEARRRVQASADGGPPIDPNLLDSAHLAAARAGDAAWFDWLLGRLSAETDPAARRRYLVSLASFEEPALCQRALDLIVTEVVPMQDVSTFVGTLLAGPATADRAFDHLAAHFPEVARRAAAPMLLRRIVESLGELSHRRAEVEALLSAPQVAAALSAVPQAVRQTRERLRLDEEVRARALPEVRAWLAQMGE